MKTINDNYKFTPSKINQQIAEDLECEYGATEVSPKEEHKEDEENEENEEDEKNEEHKENEENTQTTSNDIFISTSNKKSKPRAPPKSKITTETIITTTTKTAPKKKAPVKNK